MRKVVAGERKDQRCFDYEPMGVAGEVSNCVMGIYVS